MGVPLPGGYRVEFDIRQEQDTALFRMPLDVAFATLGDSVRSVVWDSLRVQHVSLRVRDSVTAVAVDPDGWVITVPASARSSRAGPR